jgi:hypothetical protein
MAMSEPHPLFRTPLQYRWGIFNDFRSFVRLQRLGLKDARAMDLIQGILQKRLSYLGASKLIDLYERTLEIEDRNRSGSFIEAGCAYGGSAIVIASAKKKSRPFMIFDTFGMIPPPSEHDGMDAYERYAEILSGKSKGIRGGEYYGYVEDLIEKVRGNLDAFELPIEANTIQLIRGEFGDTLKLSEPVAFAHIDADWYDSVMLCLTRIEPLLTSQGVLVIDDYFTWRGCRNAVDDYFHDRKGNYDFERKEALHILKK